MPNWCYTKLTVEGEPGRLAEFRQKYCREHGALELNRVVPMPKELRIDDGSDLYQAQLAMKGEWNEVLASPWFQAAPPTAKASREALIAWLDKEYPHIMRLGRQAASNVERFGFPTWYKWCICHWGTKWEIDENDVGLRELGPRVIVLRFQTAWSPILPVLAVMSRVFPDLRFEMAYADEGGGFAGVATATDGVVEDKDADWEHVMEAELGFDLDEEASSPPIVRT